MCLGVGHICIQAKATRLLISCCFAYILVQGFKIALSSVTRVYIDRLNPPELGVAPGNMQIPCEGLFAGALHFQNAEDYQSLHSYVISSAAMTLPSSCISIIQHCNGKPSLMTFECKDAYLCNMIGSLCMVCKYSSDSSLQCMLT